MLYLCKVYLLCFAVLAALALCVAQAASYTFVVPPLLTVHCRAGQRRQALVAHLLSGEACAFTAKELHGFLIACTEGYSGADLAALCKDAAEQGEKAAKERARQDAMSAKAHEACVRVWRAVHNSPNLHLAGAEAVPADDGDSMRRPVLLSATVLQPVALISSAAAPPLHNTLGTSIYCIVSKELLTNHTKIGLILINTARGAIIENLDIIIEGLKSNKLAAVGLDVLPEEPPSKENLLIKTWLNTNEPLSNRIIINPHAAYYSSSSIIEMRTKASQNMLNCLKGKKLKNIVNLNGD